jgi:16S rRNA (guanine527-N7)-methyltransferase
VKLRQLVEDGLRYFQVQYNEQVIADIVHYVEELEKWNRHVNLTGLKSAEAVVTVLLYDAFFVNRLIKGDRTILDLGSGAGILAIPLKILNSGMSVISVDKNTKKIQFQRHIARRLHLKDFTALQGKIEELDAMEVDALLVKAFGGMEMIFEKGGRHIRHGGRAMMLKTERDEPVDAAGFVLEETIPYRLPLGEKALRIFIYKKIS